MLDKANKKKISIKIKIKIVQIRQHMMWIEPSTEIVIKRAII